ncbi:winged helix-turn-helix transcriptional regulator [Dyadobacter luticola]|uniref:Winged helix-turn-helix transcriptional regulator n=2 Tax=Dyadobacter luticola TaxID=1979387 RepID=A0A5R9KZS6_9BACT|nr:winged helix-turn-helix transcriptional regulator [Dyadobacter luticola]
MLYAGILLGTGPTFANNDNFRFAEKVNIALRRTAHHLLISNGDSTSTIEPVKQVDANTFSVQVENVLTYDKLPGVLAQSLQMQHIERGYNVSVRDCGSSKIKLGYNFQELRQPGGVACQGRTQKGSCYVLQISFEPDQANVAGGLSNWWVLPFGTALAGLGFIAWNRSRHKIHVLQVGENPALNAGNKLLFGNSCLDLVGQVLESNKTIHQLTYREAKLLTLFVKHPNQVLERDLILKSVWEDEGVTVGRSVDVFVSRLRKMLSNDPQVKIAAVHGIGYKLEVLS